MPTTAPVTQRDIANACGLHPSTICLALGNSPSIPAETRTRVQEMALKLGYQPNAAARNLAFLRADKKEATLLPLAWINQEPIRGFWHTHPVARTYFEGARQRAQESGYYLEEFWTQEPGMRLSRLVQIIHARGVQGVVFPVYQALDPHLFGPVWEELATIAFNDHRAAEWLDVVCPDSFHNFDFTLKQLLGRGFTRIGMVSSREVDATTDGLGCCRYLRWQSEQPATERIPVCTLSADESIRAEQVRQWAFEYRPEVILMHGADQGPWIAALDEEVALASWGACGSGAGVNDRAAAIASLAIDCVTDKIRRFERGFGSSPRRHLIKGRWQDHPSLERCERVVA